MARRERLTIYEHITRSARERRGNAIELARELHLAAETRGLGKAERHVKHVIFVVLTLTVVSAEQGPKWGGLTSGSGRRSKCSGVRITWHVEHATEPSHAPVWKVRW